MKTFLKSAAVGLVGMGLFFSFFMMVSIPLLAGLARMHGRWLLPDEVIAPTHWFRYAGLPLSGSAFVVGFVAGWKKFNSVRQ